MAVLEGCKGPYLLGIDPGFAAMGWAAVELCKDTETVHSMGVIRTEKSDKKRKVRASEDNVRRMGELWQGLEGFLWPDLIAICTESQSWPRSAGTIAKLGMAWGVIGSIAELGEVPILQASPQQIKRDVAGARNASKVDVRLALALRYPDLPWPSKKIDLEHCGDAMGAVVSCLDSDVVRLARRMM